MKPRFKNKLCIRKEPALSRRSNFRRKQQGLFLFTQNILLAFLKARLFPMALAAPYGRKSLRRCLFMVCASFVPLVSPPSPLKSLFHHALLPRFSLFPSSHFPGEKVIIFAKSDCATRKSAFGFAIAFQYEQGVRKCCAVSKRLSIWSNRKTRIRRSPYIPSVCGARKAR